MPFSINHLKAARAFKTKKDICNYPPFKIYIEPTNICNLKCKACPNSIMKRKKGYMDFSLFRKILNDSDHFIKQVYLFHSGESMLHPKFIDMVKELKKRKIKVVLYTNATMLNKQNTKRLINTDIDVISISLHSEKVKKNVKNLQKLLKYKKKPKLIVQVLENEKRRGLKNIIIRKLHNYCGKLNFRIDKSKYYGCFWPYYMLSVLWNGDVVICCRDYEGEFILGNVKNEKLKDIWNNKKTRSFRRLINNKNPPVPCSKCDRLYMPELTLKQIIKELIYD